MYQEKLNLLLHIKITKDKEVSELSRDIRWFRDKYDFLSNSYQAPVTYEGITYDSSECAFQAQKTLDNEVRKTFQHMTPIAAKKAEKAYSSEINGTTSKVLLCLKLYDRNFFSIQISQRNF